MNYSFAFQPILNIDLGKVVSYEALIRGTQGESASSVLALVPPNHLQRVDDMARCRAIVLAAQLGLRCNLNLNVLPRSLENGGAFLQETFATATAQGISLDRLVLEVTEEELVKDYAALLRTLNECRALGIRLAIDDFGAGYAGLNMLAEFQPDLVKLDMALIRRIEGHGPRQAIVRAVNQACLELGIEVLAEGVETEAEFSWCRRLGIALFQGYLFGKPGFEKLPALTARTAAAA